MKNIFWSWHTELVNTCVSLEVFLASQRPDVTTYEQTRFLLKSLFTCLGSGGHQDCYQYPCTSLFLHHPLSPKKL